MPDDFTTFSTDPTVDGVNEPFRIGSGGSQEGDEFGRSSQGGNRTLETIITTSLAIVTAFTENKADKDAAAELQKRLDAARKAASTENFMAIVQDLQPLFRELVASGLGPQFQQAVRRNAARTGRIGSGSDDAIRNATAAIPDIFALQQASGEAGRIQGTQVGAELGIPIQGAISDPFSEALVRGSTAFFKSQRRDVDDRAVANQGIPQRTGGRPGIEPDRRDLFPNISPDDRSRRGGSPFTP